MPSWKLLVPVVLAVGLLLSGCTEKEPKPETRKNTEAVEKVVKPEEPQNVEEDEDAAVQAIVKELEDQDDVKLIQASPNHQWVVYASGEDEQGSLQLFVRNVKEASPIKLAEADLISEVNWSPDGLKLWVDRGTSVLRYGEVYNLAGTEVKHYPLNYWGEVYFSPDSSRIAYAEINNETNKLMAKKNVEVDACVDIRSMDLGSGEISDLFIGKPDDPFLAWVESWVDNQTVRISKVDIRTDDVAYVSLNIHHPVDRDSKQESASVAQSAVLTGSFFSAGSNPMYSGEAEVKQTGEGSYNLRVFVLAGMTYHIGELDVDFKVDGGKIVVLTKEPEDLSISFTENSVSVDYPREGWGGMNAEPKGTFYLSSTNRKDTPFIDNLLKAMELDNRYRNEKTEILTFFVHEDRLILLVRPFNSTDKTPGAEMLMLYDSKKQSFQMLGEVASYNASDLKAKLSKLGVDPDQAYEMMNKAAYDRYLTVLHERFDAGDQSVYEDTFRLTDEEAFFIATGLENGTYHEEDMRDANGEGSVFITEVDSADEDTVTIHIYELVTYEDEGGHTATADWLEVNRSTGVVRSTIFE